MTKLNTFQQYSESGRLRKVVVGRWQEYADYPEYIEVVNESQKSGLPNKALLEEEFVHFIEVLEKHQVQVVLPRYVGRFVYDQLTPRDIGVAIGNRFIVCNMVSQSRRYEVAGIFHELNQMVGDPKPGILVPTGNDIHLEGGDILVHNECIFIGISQRTNAAGAEYLEHTFGDEFRVVPVHCKQLNQGEDVLHLDCTLNFIGKHTALIYPDGFEEISDEIREGYDWLQLTRDEQALLGTNVLSIDPHTLVARKHPGLTGLNARIRDMGFEVIELPFDGATATGGSFRCCSLPLVREKPV